MKKLLLLSAGKPCRAVMAKALLDKYIDKNLNIKLISAGIEASKKINKNAMKTLVDEDFDLILTMCSHSKEVCQKFPRRVPTLHMEFPVIIDENEAIFKELAIRIKTKVKPLIIQELF